ncbi:hypothetical protein ACFYSF_48295 [Streptomyces canus]|uniref:hypothetical protein n=1 Tax=Streptomyces canus TaxID=58343 RepID=UPI00368AE8C3
MSSEATFLVLGEVQVVSLRDWHGRMTPTASKLLALLLSTGREVMSARHLVCCLGRVCSVRCPSDAAGPIMKLRGQLGRDGWSIAKSSGQGYCLVLDDADVDRTS